jgi:probable rRNA maturation factor
VVDIAFVAPECIRRLNSIYRGRDYPTDVLSFGYTGEFEDGLPWLGEIVLAPDVALTNALRWRTSPDREVRKLLVHGTLHLLGYDHEADDGRMSRLQRRLIRRALFWRLAPLMVHREHRQ